MRLTAFETYLRERLPGGLTIKALAEAVGVCRQTLYRKFQQSPWREGRGSFEGRLFARLAVVLQGDGKVMASELDRERNTLLWLSGFNPFVERGLSEEDMLTLYAAAEKKVGELLAKREAKRGA